MIAPLVPFADFANFGAEIHAIEGQGADWVHVDVMDARSGVFSGGSVGESDVYGANLAVIRVAACGALA